MPTVPSANGQTIQRPREETKEKAAEKSDPDRAQFTRDEMCRETAALIDINQKEADSIPVSGYCTSSVMRGRFDG